MMFILTNVAHLVFHSTKEWAPSKEFSQNFLKEHFLRTASENFSIWIVFAGNNYFFDVNKFTVSLENKTFIECRKTVICYNIDPVFVFCFVRI